MPAVTILKYFGVFFDARKMVETFQLLLNSNDSLNDVNLLWSFEKSVCSNFLPLQLLILFL